MNRKKKQPVKLFDNIPIEARPSVRYWVPGAAMDEQDLRSEIRALFARGFGRIELVVLSGRNYELDAGEDGWGTENWDRMVRIAADETEKLGMKLDIANGPGWPISSPVIQSADDPAAIHELVYGEMHIPGGTVYEGLLPERKTIREEGTPKLIALMAYALTEGKVLRQDSYIDLMSAVSTDGKSFCFEAPADAKEYCVFAFYMQPSVHKINSGLNYVIDHLSKAGVKACKDYWDTVFSAYDYPSVESFFCDSLEYQVKLEWTPGFEDIFLEKYGYDIRPFLPVIGEHDQMLSVPEVPGYRFEDRKISEMANREFMDALTYCYCEFHLKGLEEMAESYGKSIRYQVAYNKPFEEEISALYPGIPENEALGRPAFDAMKTMAAAAHLGRKKRYSFECAAEFGFGYNQTYEDLLWWVKRAQMAGMNAQVFHGASYSGAYHGRYSENGRVPGAVWPGYEGFGRFVSNNWNRTLSIEDAREVLNRIARSNMIFLGTKKVDCAVLRSAYTNTGEGGEHYVYRDDGRLSNAGYSYEFITEHLLDLPVCTVRNGELDPEGAAYRALIVMPGVELSLHGVRQLRSLMDAGLPIVFCQQDFDCRFFSDYHDPERYGAYQTELSALMAEAEKRNVFCELPDVPKKLEFLSVYPRIRATASCDLITAVHETESEDFYIIYANNRVAYDYQDEDVGDVHIKGTLRLGTLKGTYERPGDLSRTKVNLSIEACSPVYLINLWTGTEELVSFTEKDGRMEGTVQIEEDEMLIFGIPKTPEDILADPLETDQFHKTVKQMIPIRFNRLTVYPFEPDTSEEVSFLRSHFLTEGKSYSITEPHRFDEVDPELERFSGRGVYEGCLYLSEKTDSDYVLRLGKAVDTVKVIINGRKVRGFDQVFRRAEIGEYLQQGENRMIVEVTTNLHARLTASFDPENYRHVPFGMPSMDHFYGMWEEPGFPIGVMEMA